MDSLIPTPTDHVELSALLDSVSSLRGSSCSQSSSVSRHVSSSLVDFARRQDECIQRCFRLVDSQLKFERQLDGDDVARVHTAPAVQGQRARSAGNSQGDRHLVQTAAKVGGGELLALQDRLCTQACGRKLLELIPKANEN
eukprot:GHVT01047573.1.p2 GENE.GHVT01047573.1~~GHVT01047573.1.p2  ORF type:complete len:141 (-),score=12.75 GHVT01047573.1:128-550(-)